MKDKEPAAIKKLTAKDKYLSEKALGLIHWIIGFVIFCIVLATWSCAPKERIVTEYKEVLTPVKCGAEMPSKPAPADDPVEMNLLILRYAEELEAILRSCL